MTAERGWVVDLLKVLEHALEDDGKISFQLPNGEQLYAEVSQEILDLVRDNQQYLISMGFETFQLFLVHKSKGEDLEALEVLYSKLDTDELVELAKITAMQMDQHARKIQEVKKFWLDFAKKLGTRVALGLLSTLVV